MSASCVEYTYGYLFLRLRNATSYTRAMAWQAHGKLEDHLL
jgi:hypothetical protein